MQMAVIAAQIHHLAWCQQPPLAAVAALLVLAAQILEAQQAALVVAVLVVHLDHWQDLQELLDKVILAVQVKMHLHLAVEAEAAQEPLEQMRLLRQVEVGVLEPLPQFLARQLFTLVAGVVAQTVHQQPQVLVVMVAVVLELEL